MKLIQLLGCIRGRHVRSRGSAYPDGELFRSQCRGCGAPMVRTPHGWQLDTKRPTKL